MFHPPTENRAFLTSNSDVYRYTFQGQEHDDEIKGEGNSINYTFRMHDPRLGRFFAVDPLSRKYAHNSPYSFSQNIVINGVELEGAEVKITSIYTEKGIDGAYHISDIQTEVRTAMQAVLYDDKPKPSSGEVGVHYIFTYDENKELMGDQVKYEYMYIYFNDESGDIIKVKTHMWYDYDGDQQSDYDMKQKISDDYEAIWSQDWGTYANKKDVVYSRDFADYYVQFDLEALDDAMLATGVLVPLSFKPGSKGGPGGGKNFNNSTKNAAEKEANGRCAYCGVKTTRSKTPSPTRRHTDHIISKKNNGNNTIRNADNTCQTCNLQKGGRDKEEFLRDISNGERLKALENRTE